MKRRIPALLLLALLSALCVAADPSADDLLEQQRAVFREARADAERGSWQAAQRHEDVLRTYVLWPDLRATWLRANLTNADHDEINAFLAQYGTLKPARELRYQFALHLADEGRFTEYLELYQQFYQGLGIARLDCLALQAEIEAGQGNRIGKRAENLWLVGKSQADECDQVFEFLRGARLLTTDHYLQRFDLAIEAKHFSLARYLARFLDSRYLNVANEWLDAQNDPANFIGNWMDYADTSLSKQLFAYAVERLAVNDPHAASVEWHKLSRHFSYSAAQTGNVNRHIALWAARTHSPFAEEMLSSLSAQTVDVETGRWIVRTRLLARRWPDVIRGVDSLPATEGSKDEWQYWKAVALQEVGQVAEARQVFLRLMEDRGYYGFLAADALGANYMLSETPVAQDPQVIAALTQRPELVRARELFFVGLEGRGRSEWDAAVRLMNSDEQLQAALLADSWGWHSRAIATVAIAGVFDDLRIRYPLPWREVFEQHAGTAGVSNSWAYGIARSESLFMRDIRSSAGAIGIMQLMPATGRSTAREIQLPWSGQATLTDSSSNIRLGTRYLGEMFARFDQNRVLATAAYNAGPQRVERWLPASGILDARIWIENIPYNETRGYVRRVLTDDTIFHWRMTGQQRRLSDELAHIAAATDRGLVVNTD